MMVAWVCSGCANARYDAKEAQHPAITMPHRFAEGSGDAQPEETRKKKAPPASNPSVPNGATTAPSFDAASLPEPAPLNSRTQWEYVFSYRHGEVTIERTTLKRFESPVPTARRVGRFAVELWIGRELVERVRFDFPLLAGEEVPSGPAVSIDAPARLGPGADVRRTILVPADERATRAELVDDATRTRTPLPWPPDAPIAPIAPENAEPGHEGTAPIQGPPGSEPPK